jgi:hypothetical protein
MGWFRFAFILTAIVAAAVAAADVRFTGRLLYRDSSGLTFPARHVQVNALDENFGALDSLQFSAYTNSTGNFDFTVPTKGDTGPLDSGLIDPYLMVTALSDPEVGFRLRVTSADEMTGYPYSGGYTFSSTFFDATGTVNLGTLVIDRGTAGTSDANAEKAFQTFDYALDYLQAFNSLGFTPVSGFFEAGYSISVRDVTSTLASQNSHQFGSLSNYNWRTPRTTLSASDATRAWAIARAIAFQQLYWWDYLQFSGDGSFSSSRLPYQYLGVNVFPSEATVFDSAVGEVQAWVDGSTTYLASLVVQSTNAQRWNPSGTLLTYNIESNWDGIGTANSNIDGASDANLSGRFQPAAVAAFLQDIFDAANPGVDAFDNTEAPLSLLSFLYSGATARINTMQEFVEQWTTRSYESQPMIFGTAQVHGLTQNRVTRPTIGLTALTPSGTPWFWNGPASASMTVLNYGSQPFSSFDTARSLDLRLRNPSGATYVAGPMLGTSTLVTSIAGGTSRTYTASVPQIWPGTVTTGVYQLHANAYVTGGSLRSLMTVRGGPVNPVPVTVGFGGVAPRVTVTDPGEYQVSRTSLVIDVSTAGSVSAITKYEVALGTAPGLTNVAAFRTITSSATSISTTFTGLSVAFGTRVFATARVTNAEALVGTGNSDGIVMGDATPPDCTVDDLGDYQSSRTGATFRTTATDANGALTKVEYCISSTSSYDGDLRPWTTVATYPVSSLVRTANLLVNASGLSLPNGSAYYVGVRWTNAEGYVDFALTNGKFVVNGNFITGRLALEGLANPADISFFPATFTFTDAAGASVQTATLNTLSTGSYAIPVNRTDSVNVSVKLPFFGLRKRLPLVLSTLGSMDFTLLNGDCDGDNTVSILDYIMVSTAYDTAFGDPGYQFEADCDLDGLVSIFDYLIVSGNYEISGDDL